MPGTYAYTGDLTQRAKPREGQEEFERLQRFFITVETLDKERRLLRIIYLAQKTGTH